MELSEKDIALFEQYSSNLLSDQEEEAISMQLITDKSFNLKYQRFLQIKQGIRANRLKTVLDNLKALEKKEFQEGDLGTVSSLKEGSTETRMFEQGIRYHTLKRKLESIQEIEDEPPRRKLSFWAPVSIAATIFVLLGVFFWLTGPKLDPVVQAYFQPYESIGGVRSPDEPNILHQAYAYYDQEKYGRAIKMFKRSIAEEKTETKQFFLANAFLARGDAEEAADLLQELIDENSDDERFLWYLALCKIDMKQKTEASELLQELIRKGKYLPEATELLNKLSI